MAEQKSRAIDIDVSEGIKSLKRIQKEIRKTLQLAKGLEKTFGKCKSPITQNITVNQSAGECPLGIREDLLVEYVRERTAPPTKPPTERTKSKE